MSGAVAIFVKSPGFSPVKTRLAVTLGKDTAEHFHLASAKAVAEVVQTSCQANDVQGYFAVAEQGALQHQFWHLLPCLWQGGGGLGKRMALIYQTLLKTHDFVILVGADIPQMTISELQIAFTWLSHEGQARFVFAPSIDGGFWLFGGNCTVPQAIWTDVTYSVADTGAQFLSGIESVGEVKKLAALCDVDEVDDLILLRQSLVKMSSPLSAQRQLLQFLQTLSTVKVS